MKNWLKGKEQRPADLVQASLAGGSRIPTPETLLRGHNLRHFSWSSNQFQFATATSRCHICKSETGAKI